MAEHNLMSFKFSDYVLLTFQINAKLRFQNEAKLWRQKFYKNIEDDSIFFFKLQTYFFNTEFFAQI